MSLISRLKAVVAGDEYLDDDFDELDDFNEFFNDTNDIEIDYEFNNNEIEKIDVFVVKNI